MRSTNIRGRNVAFYPGTKISPFGGLPNANREIGVPGKNPEQRKAINVQSDLCATRSGTRKITIYKSQVTIHRFTNHQSPITSHQSRITIHDSRRPPWDAVLKHKRKQ